MDFFLSRYRNLSVLLIVIVAQLLLIAYQVKSNKDVPMLRVWAVTAVTPIESSLEFVRRHTWGYVADYFVLLNVRSQNEKLQHENGQLKLQNQYLKSELSTADRAQALSVFQSRSPSKFPGGARHRQRNRRKLQSGFRRSRLSQRSGERNGGRDAGWNCRQSS